MDESTKKGKESKANEENKVEPQFLNDFDEKIWGKFRKKLIKKLGRGIRIKIGISITSGIAIIAIALWVGKSGCYSWNFLSFLLQAISGTFFSGLALIKVKNVREEPIKLHIEPIDVHVVVFAFIVFLGSILTKYFSFCG